LASVSTHQNKPPTTGDNIMVAGLSFQVFTLLIFIILCTDFAIRTYRRFKSMGQDAFDQNPAFVNLRQGWQFKAFLAALALATICIFWRSVYRVAELSEGWTGNLIRHQWLFVGFEGVMVIVSCLVLNVYNPAIMFKDAMEGLGGIGSKKKALKQENAEKNSGVTGDNSRSASASESDVETGIRNDA